MSYTKKFRPKKVIPITKTLSRYIHNKSNIQNDDSS